jgi:hypothetical protein
MSVKITVMLIRIVKLSNMVFYTVGLDPIEKKIANPNPVQIMPTVTVLITIWTFMLSLIMLVKIR